MAQIAPLVINDGLATPVARNFLPVQSQSGQNIPALWNYKAATQRTSYVRMTGLVRRTGTNEATKVQLTQNYPVIDLVTGLVRYTLLTKVEMVVPDLATQADIDNAFAFLKNSLAHAQMTSMFKDLEAPL